MISQAILGKKQFFSVVLITPDRKILSFDQFLGLKPLYNAN